MNISSLQDEKEQLIKTHFWVRQVRRSELSHPFSAACVIVVLLGCVLLVAAIYWPLISLQDWNNPYMTWKPEDYGGVMEIQIPPDMLWVPDIILYNK